MTHPAFDAAGFIRFDLQKGAIQSRSNDAMALIPLSFLGHMEANNEILTAAKQWGNTHGQTFITDGGPTAFDEGMEILTDHLAGVLAVMGLGRLSIEIHGNALLFRLTANEGLSLSSTIQAIIGAFLEGYLESIMPNSPFSTLSLSGSTEEALYYAGNPYAVQTLDTMLKSGKSPFDAVSLLATKGVAQ